MRATVMYQLTRLCVLALVMNVGPVGSDQTLCDPIDSGAAESRLEQARLRKLHLVRPDLIPYPIYFEVYC